MLRIRTNTVHEPCYLPPYSERRALRRATQPSLLIVDDDPQVLKVATRLLRHAWQIFVASNPYDALHYLRQRPFDAVLSDYEMPERDGLWLLEQAWRIQPGVRRVLHSGGGPHDLREHLRSGLVHCFVAKPSGREELLDALKSEPHIIRN